MRPSIKTRLFLIAGIFISAMAGQYTEGIALKICTAGLLIFAAAILIIGILDLKRNWIR